MTRYFKEIEGEYIIVIGTGPGGEEITQAEYEDILSIVASCPKAPEGYGYKLKTDLSWALSEAPAVQEEEPEATQEDYIAALAQLGVSIGEEG